MRWADDYDQDWTLAAPVERCGIGLHSGGMAKVRLAPSARPGYWLGWLDRRRLPRVLAEARKIPGWDDGPEHAPHPVTARPIEDDEEYF